MIEYKLEFKVEGRWLETKPEGDIETLRLAEEIMHKAGIKARIVKIKTEREYITGITTFYGDLCK